MSAIPIECNSHCINVRYSIEPRERRYVEGYGFLSFTRNLGTHSIKFVKNLHNKYGRKLADSAKNMQQMHLKLLAKVQFKKQLKQLEIQ